MALKYMIPLAASAVLLPFIRKAETGTAGSSAYLTLYNHGEKHLAKPLTAMTLDEVEASGPAWSKRNGSSAAGAYQFMKDTLDRPGTLADIEGEMGLTGKELFSPELQDAMAMHLLERRGWDDFVNGRIPLAQFALNLSKEWASFPVLGPVKGAHGLLHRGQSYYDGDGRNSATITPEAVEACLQSTLTMAQAGAVPTPAPTPAQPEEPQGWLAIIIAAVKAFLKAITGR